MMSSERRRGLKTEINPGYILMNNSGHVFGLLVNFTLRESRGVLDFGGNSDSGRAEVPLIGLGSELSQPQLTV